MDADALLSSRAGGVGGDSIQNCSKALQSLWLPREPALGKLIAIEGFDGSGKTTQLELIAARLKNEGRTVCVTRQPTTWYRNQPIVREFMESGTSLAGRRIMMLLSAADRLLHVQTVVIPALSRGEFVLCDRYVFAALALFQARGIAMQDIIAVNRGIVYPDAAFYLSVAPGTAMKRISARDGSAVKYEERSIEGIAKIMRCYDPFIGDALIRIDADQSIEAVNEEIVQALSARGII